jgi:putative peptidoglycan lipid II flippase
MASHPIEPLTFLFFTSVASTLVAGSVSAVSFARNFQSVPVALIGVAISVAAFPTLSNAWAAGDRAGFSRLVRSSATTIVVVSVIAAVGLAIVGPLAIDVLLGGGAFDSADVVLTATVLVAFAISVPFDSIGHLLARGLYATHNTLLPLGAALAGFAVTIVTTLALVDRVGIVSIPLGFAAGLAVRTVLQAVALGYRMRTASPAAPPDLSADLAPSG